MKNIIFLFILSFILFSCSHQVPLEPISKIQVAVPKKEETKNDIKPLPEITNLDEEFQKSMAPIWSGYFKEDFTDSRSLDIFIVTNRNAKNARFGCTNDNYGIGMDPSLHFGIFKINVPKNHSTGQINFTRDGRQNSHEFFKILNSKALTETAMLDFLKKIKRTPLVFVHGFNVRYQDAVLRAAQIAYDLKYQGPIILFTWPSGAGDGFFDDKMITRTYENNFKSAQASREILKKFLMNLQSQNLKINLVVHSMGHQVVLPVLKELGESQAIAPFINELILNAPDFETGEFSRLIENIKATSKRITLYCSYNDKAMLASETFNKTERLGACTFSENLDTINVSLIEALSSGLGHSYYSSRAIITDVFQVLLGIEAEKRLFIRRSEPNSTEKYFLRQ
jgi:esterase/lipase superfamily enzyme